MTLGLEEVLEIVVDALETEDIDYAITGAMASAYHGYARATQDLDLKVRTEDRGRLDPVLARLPEGVRRIDDLTWRFEERWDVEIYLPRGELDHRALASREEGQLFETSERMYWIVPLEALLVLKIREHLIYPDDLKHVDDVRKLLARNHDRLDATRLEELLALDPAWEAAWEELVEPGP